MKVLWKDINDYKGLYQISNTGLVKSLSRKVIGGNNIRTLKERILKHNVNKKGYKYVNLHRENNSLTVTIHRLVAVHFLPCSENELQVNHKDCNKLNNNVDNLEWCTPEENTKHAVKNSLYLYGENNKSSKLTSSDVLDIRYYAGVIKNKILSNIYHVNERHIRSIINRETWKRI